MTSVVGRLSSDVICFVKCPLPVISHTRDVIAVLSCRLPDVHANYVDLMITQARFRPVRVSLEAFRTPARAYMDVTESDDIAGNKIQEFGDACVCVFVCLCVLGSTNRRCVGTIRQWRASVMPQHARRCHTEHVLACLGFRRRAPVQ